MCAQATKSDLVEKRTYELTWESVTIPLADILRLGLSLILPTIGGIAFVDCAFVAGRIGGQEPYVVGKSITDDSSAAPRKVHNA